ncbi:MAG: hypothetical protein DRQ49_16870 [Gammaproteobacteria bacterium]|nr:MAG: hypothetical protein DRQ49_16870 [Gammaproteobacteria bacterium]RKZ39608.1 MAG: hypothetical protein DRQ41_10375 [Gammaproteobacteria bacterium]
MVCLLFSKFKESSNLKQGVPNFEYKSSTPNQISLFDMAQPLDDLAKMLLDKFAGRTMTVKEVYEQHHVGKHYIEKNYKEILKQLESEGTIIIVPPASQRRKIRGEVTLANHVKVTFPIQ